MWPLYYGRSYPSEGIDALAYSSGGFLWENAQAKGKTVTVFGEYAPAIADSSDSVRTRDVRPVQRRAPTDFALHRDMLKARYNTHSDIPSLDRALVREYPGWTQEVPDVVKAGDILAHLGDWESARTMPDLVMVILPNDHTEGTSAGWCMPRACVADNDLALGKIVEGLTQFVVLEGHGDLRRRGRRAERRGPHRRTSYGGARDLAVHASAVSWTRRSTRSRAW